MGSCSNARWCDRDACIYSRATDVDRRQQPSVRLDRLRPSFGAHDLVPEHQALIAAGARIAEEICQRLLPRHVEVFSVREIHSPLHELRHVDLGVFGKFQSVASLRIARRLSWSTSHGWASGNDPTTVRRLHRYLVSHSLTFPRPLDGSPGDPYTAENTTTSGRLVGTCKDTASARWPSCRVFRASAFDVITSESRLGCYPRQHTLRGARTERESQQLRPPEFGDVGYSAIVCRQMLCFVHKVQQSVQPRHQACNNRTRNLRPATKKVAPHAHRRFLKPNFSPPPLRDTLERNVPNTQGLQDTWTGVSQPLDQALLSPNNQSVGHPLWVCQPGKLRR